ncbi:MAG TPA: hypothetical protein VGK44_08015 [Casimicrobiaceae bacterium]|jgi:hypothetical protein
MFPRRALITATLVLAVSSVAMPAIAAGITAKPSMAIQNNAASMLINRILDRWYPVASLLHQDVAIWRAQFKSVLERTSLATLQTLDAMEAKDTGPNRTLITGYRQALATAVTDAASQLAGQASPGHVAKLGSATSDLVFVPLTPCRIVDTRVVGGPISAATQVNFYYYSENGTPSSWSTQGGDPGPVGTACPNTALASSGGTLGTVPPAAAVITITAVNTSAAGNFVVWGGGPITSVPNTSMLNWDHAGEVIANTTIIPWGGRTGGNLDFTVRYNGGTGSSNVVMDVVGYFIENAATALDCTTTTNSGPINIGTGSDTTLNYPACPAGYSRTGGYCNGGASTGTSGIYVVETGATACVFRNLGGGTATGNAISQCCRVPGR